MRNALAKIFKGADVHRDVYAGLMLAAIAIPECIGYTKIVAMPVVAGLYTILLPLMVFSLLASSRHLVVGADSATAAILFAGLVRFAEPYSQHWQQLASLAALMTALLLFIAWVMRLGFVADFLSRTVLVGFLSGVGVSLMISQLPDLLGIEAPQSKFIEHVFFVVQHVHDANAATLILSACILVFILLMRRIARKFPAGFVALVLALLATAMFRLKSYGVRLLGEVQSGFPHLSVPHISLQDGLALGSTSVSMVLVILAQSAATSRSYSQRHRESFDENRDILALAFANLFAALSQTFVVNGSPTKTAVVDASGGRSQLAQFVTFIVVGFLLTFSVSFLAWLPHAALACLVFVIGLGMIDIAALRQIYLFRKRTFAVAIGTLVSVLFLGVERGIFIAVVFSVVDHLQQEYRPKDSLLQMRNGHWSTLPATPGTESDVGLLIYRFDAPLFFANSDYFVSQVLRLVEGAPHAVRWFIFDFVSLSDIDYSGALAFEQVLSKLQRDDIIVAIARPEDVLPELEKMGIVEKVSARVFNSVGEAVTALRG